MAKVKTYASADQIVPDTVSSGNLHAATTFDSDKSYRFSIVDPVTEVRTTIVLSESEATLLNIGLGRAIDRVEGP